MWMYTLIIIVAIYSEYGNAVAIDHVGGFESQAKCEEVARVLSKGDINRALHVQTVCARSLHGGK